MTDCFHCGLAIPTDTKLTATIKGQQQSFCCPGCQAVAQAIISNGLEDYYSYRSEFAEKAPELGLNSALTVFDDQSILQDFVEQHQHNQSIQLSLAGIHCSACGWLIEKQLSKIEGIVQVGVNVSARRAKIVWDPEKIKLSQIFAAIESIGYQAKPFQQEQHEATYQHENKAFLKRLGLAGLMTMQVMMLNIGVFFDWFGHIDQQTKQYFNWVSLLMATPVMLYSATGFYSGAFRALKSRQVNMDLPISLALSLTYLAGLLATVHNTGQTYFESLCMFVFFLLVSRYVEHSARYKASQLSANMLEYMPAIATLIEQNRTTTVLAKSLKIGQQVLVKSGEMIPIDGVILDGQGQIDEAMLTGEFNLVEKDTGDLVFAGTTNQLGTLTIKVTKVLKQSMVSQINALQTNALFNKPKLASVADQFSQYFVLAVLVIAAQTYWAWTFIAPEQALWVTVSVLIATCPCALGLATPSALSSAVANLNSQGILVKQADVLEKIANLDWIAFDKTGTLTQGQFSLAESISVDGIQTSTNLVIAASLQQYSSHPIAKAFSHVHELLPVQNFTAHVAQGVSGQINNTLYKLGSASFVEHDIPKQLKSCQVFLANDKGLLAGFKLEDNLRADAHELIAQLGDLEKTILSGDSKATVASLAQQLGIKNCFANQSPEDKLNKIKQLQNQHKVVLMLGDGINDGPVLAQADISVTLGVGSDLAKSSADVILLDNQLSRLLPLIQVAKRCKTKIKQNIAWAIGYNLLILPLAVTGLLAPWMAVVGMSLSSLIVIVNSVRLLK
ncbi:heavy metal translocating P-type ATPase [Paraglaciecola aestuariivivens]